ncbi:DUF4145 domain-containing protein [Actinoplanes sp. NPDC051513]|uniref:DUF4145 domain-containing protein n=1 Tax=Actinoplanes sp. NPDC051513 TaxID=3363908 RepID=UPI003796FB8C
MTDPLLEFIADSPNFAYLAPHSVELAGDGASAEAYVDVDPDAALARARRFGETAIDLLLLHFGQSPQGKDNKRMNFEARIIRLKKAGIFPANLESDVTLLRERGNEAVHDYLRDREMAAKAVRVCFDLGRWWHRLATGREADLTFTPPAPRATPRELLKQLDSELSALRAERNAAAPVVTIGPAAPDPDRWRAGSIVADSYVVYEPVARTTADDGSWTLLEADGRGRGTRAEPVRLRAVRADCSRAALRMVEGLDVQAAYLKKRKRLLAQRTDGSQHTTVAARPAGSTWRQTFGGGEQPLDPLVVPLAVNALAAVAEALADLHRAGAAHRALNGESILVTLTGRRGELRDLGLAWWPPLREEGGEYRAPEQRSAVLGRAGPPADVYQLAALLWHTCVGARQVTGHTPPLSLLLPGFPLALERLLAQALATDPAMRPAAAAFASGLRQGRDMLATGAVDGHQ